MPHVHFSLPALRPRQPMLGLAAAALAGIALADWWEVPIAWPFAVALVAALAQVTRWRGVWVLLVLVGSAFFTLHTARHYGSEAKQLARELEPRAAVVKVRGLVWSEPEVPRAWSRTTTCHFTLRMEELEWEGVRRPCAALLQIRWAGPIPRYGDRISMLGSAHNLEPVRNPGQFDFPAYQRRLGIFSEVEANYGTDCHIESSGHGSLFRRLAQATTSRVQSLLRLGLEDAPEISSLIESMVLGVRGELMDEAQLYFQQTGTMHLFAVSGLNVAMLILIAFFLLKPLGIGRRAAFFVLLPALALYALITGPSASCLRAAIMGGLVLGSYLVERPPVPFNSLAAAALIILAWDSEQLFSPGFQFSFVLVLVLLLLASRFQRRLLPFGLPDPFLPRLLWNRRQQFGAEVWRGVSANFSVSVAAWAGSALFTAGYFHLFSLSTVLANLVAVPLSFLILALGLATLLTGWWAPQLAVLFNNANWLCAKGLLALVQAFATLPGSHTYVEKPRLGHTPECEITVLDVGSGAAIFLRSGGCDWLIDCGHGYEYERAVLPFLRSRGVNRLDGLILTHGDVQHIGAASAALSDLNPTTLVDSPLRDRSSTRHKLHADLEALSRPKRICSSGDILALGKHASLRVLYPPAGLERGLADDKAMVLLLECAGKRALFLSDAGFSTEQWLLQNVPDLHAEILVKGQHAKDFSATGDFLARVQPELIVASAPERRLPSGGEAAWSERVRQRGIRLFAQEETGAVTLELTKEGWQARTFLGAQTFRSRAR